MSRELNRSNDLLKCILDVLKANNALLNTINENTAESNEINGDEILDIKTNLWELPDSTILSREQKLFANGSVEYRFYNTDGSEYTGDVSQVSPYTRDYETSESSIWIDCVGYDVISMIDTDTLQVLNVLYRDKLTGQLIPSLPSGKTEYESCKESLEWKPEWALLTDGNSVTIPKGAISYSVLNLTSERNDAVDLSINGNIIPYEVQEYSEGDDRRDLNLAEDLVVTSATPYTGEVAFISWKISSKITSIEQK